MKLYITRNNIKWRNLLPSKKPVNSFFQNNAYYFNYGRSALQYLFKKLRIKELVLPSFICNIFSNLLLAEKIKPKFVDADLDTFNIDINQLQEAINSKTKAVLIVHTFGNPCDMKAILDLKQEYNFILIENCMHALGARYNNKHVGSFGNYSVFSMYKFLPNIAGGFLLANTDFDDYQSLKSQRLSLPQILSLIYSGFPFLQSIMYKLKQKFYSRSYESLMTDRLFEIKKTNPVVKNIFFNYFKKLDVEVNNRNKIAEQYTSFFNQLDDISLQRISHKSAYMNFSIRIKDSSKRDIIIHKLKEKGIIPTRMWHKIPVMLRSIQSKFKVNPKRYKNSIKLSKSIINLPIHGNYSSKDIAYITDSFENIYKDKGD
jgi:perosamine synthetase